MIVFIHKYLYDIHIFEFSSFWIEFKIFQLGLLYQITAKIWLFDIQL